jgi:hypothetical protein
MTPLLAFLQVGVLHGNDNILSQVIVGIFRDVIFAYEDLKRNYESIVLMGHFEILIII